VLLLGLAAAPVWAHQVSESYVLLETGGDAVQGQCEVALRDIAYVLNPARPTMRPPHEAVAAYVQARLRIGTGGTPLSLRYDESAVEERRGMTYLVLPFSAALPASAEALDVEYRLFFEDDPRHHAILYLTASGRTQTTILDLDHARQRLWLADPGHLRALATFTREGVHHIWAGVDHILFLLALLLPAVLERVAGRVEGVPHLRRAFVEIAKVVTAFTVAHSVTLTLATLRLVKPPSFWVELTIAASVLLAAINNLVPLLRGREWAMAFAFGLVHGFGFAGVLAEVGLPPGALAIALVGFNLGVELGQLAIVAFFVPLAFAARHSWAYQTLVFRFGSLAVAGVAVVWMVERASGR
jgi:hypothetical protein